MQGIIDEHKAGSPGKAFAWRVEADSPLALIEGNAQQAVVELTYVNSFSGKEQRMRFQLAKTDGRWLIANHTDSAGVWWTQPTAGAPTVDEQLKGYQVLGHGTLALPGVGDWPMWFVRQKSPVIGVLVAVQGNVIPLHRPEPQDGMLVGPDIRVPSVTVSDLDADGVKEIVIEGNAGMGPGIWVYQYDARALKFVFHGDLYGEKGISAVVGPDGKTTFEATQVDYKSKDHVVVSTAWQWKPSGFYKAVSLVSDELTIKGVGLGSSRTAVEQALGKPDQVDKAPQQNLEFYVYARYGLTVGIALNKVHILSVKSPSDARTARGIGIGSAMADVERAYGAPERPNIYYRLQAQGDTVRLEVESDHDKVTGLYFAWGFE